MEYNGNCIFIIMSCNSIQSPTWFHKIPWNIQWISMGQVRDHHMRSYMWWSHVWIWRWSKCQCVTFALFFNQPPNNPTMLPMTTTTQHPMPTTTHVCPATTTAQKTKPTPHKRRWPPTYKDQPWPSTMACERWPAPTCRHRQQWAEVSKLTSPSQSSL